MKQEAKKTQEIPPPTPFAVFHDLPSVDVGKLRRCWQPNPNPQRLAPTSRRRLVTSECIWTSRGGGWRGGMGGYRCSPPWFSPAELETRRRPQAAHLGLALYLASIVESAQWLILDGTSATAQRRVVPKPRGARKKRQRPVRDRCAYMESRTWAERVGEWCAKTEASRFGYS